MKQTRVEITRVCESCERVDSRVIITFSTVKQARYHAFVNCSWTVPYFISSYSIVLLFAVLNLARFGFLVDKHSKVCC